MAKNDDMYLKMSKAINLNTSDTLKFTAKYVFNAGKYGTIGVEVYADDLEQAEIKARSFLSTEEMSLTLVLVEEQS